MQLGSSNVITIHFMEIQKQGHLHFHHNFMILVKLYNNNEAEH